MPQQLPRCERGLLLPSTRSEHACAEEDGSAPAQAYNQIGKRLLRGTMKPPCAPARAGGRVSSHRKSVRPAAEQAAAMITAVKVAVQARSEGFLVLHHVLGLAAARSEYNAGARQDGAPSPGVTPWIKFVAGACQPLPLCTERHLIERIYTKLA